ncbi:hypothetical protein ACFX2I_026867 [Malus domestica]
MWRLTEGSNEEEENGEDGKGRLDFDGLEARCGEIELRNRKSSRIKDGIPSLVPTDGKTLEVDDTVKPEDSAESSDKHEAD